MKIRKIKLGNLNDFQEVKENFIKVIIKELYNNRINEPKYYDYDLLKTRITFLYEIMEQEECWRMYDSAYSMFEDFKFQALDYDYKIYEAKSGIVWLIVSNECLACESDIYITKNELEALKGK